MPRLVMEPAASMGTSSLPLPSSREGGVRTELVSRRRASLKAEASVANRCA